MDGLVCDETGKQFFLFRRSIADIHVLPEWDSAGREETVAEPQGATQASVPQLTRGREMLQALEGPQRLETSCGPENTNDKEQDSFEDDSVPEESDGVPGDVHAADKREFWNSLSPGAWILGVLEKGYELPFGVPPGAY